MSRFSAASCTPTPTTSGNSSPPPEYASPRRFTECSVVRWNLISDLCSDSDSDSDSSLRLSLSSYSLFFLKRVSLSRATQKGTLWMYRTDSSRCVDGMNLNARGGSGGENFNSESESESESGSLNVFVKNVLNCSPLVVRILWWWEDYHTMYLISEFCSFGSLKFRSSALGDVDVEQVVGLSSSIVENGWWTKIAMKYMVAQLVLFLELLRPAKVSHRRLSPGSVFVELADCEGLQFPRIRVSDFRWMHNPSSVSSDLSLDRRDDNLQAAVLYLIKKHRSNDLVFIPPEFFEVELSGWHNCSWDVWDLGCVVYWLLSRGSYPLTQAATAGSSKDEVVSPYVLLERLKVPENHLDFSSSGGDIGPDGRDLIRRLLVATPKDRLGVDDLEEIFAHPFFAEVDLAQLRNALF